MGSNGKFVAQLLEASSLGYSGLTVSLLFERHPEIARRYEPDGFSNWKAQLQRWILDLSAALDAGEPKLFEARMLWTRTAFAAREVDPEDLPAALAALRDILGERLPEDSAATAVSAIDNALAAIADPASGNGGDIAANEPVGRASLSYLETILKGEPREAVEQVLAGVHDEASAKDAYLNVLIPALRETGRLWHAGELGIAEEHVVTATTQRVMTLLCERARSSSPKDKTVLLACVTGNLHDIGIRAISDFFEMAGWRAINLGPNVPNDEIAKGVLLFNADVVVLAATLDPHLMEIQRVIKRIRALENRDIKIIVGGPAFEPVPELWRRVGADGYSAKIEDAEPLGSKLSR